MISPGSSVLTPSCFLYPGLWYGPGRTILGLFKDEQGVKDGLATERVTERPAELRWEFKKKNDKYETHREYSSTITQEFWRVFDN